MSDDDAELVALIDNELDESRRTALLARLAADEGLRQRYDALRETSKPLAASFDALLEQAPVARLRAALPLMNPFDCGERVLAASPCESLRLASSSALSRRRPEYGRRRLSGYWTGERIGGRRSPNIPISIQTRRSARSIRTLRNRPPSSRESRMVGANLTPENIALPGLRFTSAFMLSYDGSPMGVLAYVDPTGAPVLHCILANGATDAPTRSERRGDLSLAWWARDGRSHLVIGHIGEERALLAGANNRKTRLNFSDAL